jgi:hypothetical protein
MGGTGATFIGVAGVFILCSLICKTKATAAMRHARITAAIDTSKAGPLCFCVLVLALMGFVAATGVDAITNDSSFDCAEVWFVAGSVTVASTV